MFNRRFGWIVSLINYYENGCFSSKLDIFLSEYYINQISKSAPDYLLIAQVAEKNETEIRLITKLWSGHFTCINNVVSLHPHWHAEAEKHGHPQYEDIP